MMTVSMGRTRCLDGERWQHPQRPARVCPARVCRTPRSARAGLRARRGGAAGAVHVLQCGLWHVHAADRRVLLRPERLRHPQAGHLPVAVSAPGSAEAGVTTRARPRVHVALPPPRPMRRARAGYSCSPRRCASKSCRLETCGAGCADTAAQCSHLCACVTSDRPRRLVSRAGGASAGGCSCPPTTRCFAWRTSAVTPGMPHSGSQSPASDCSRPANPGSMSHAGTRAAL